jgi:hypothetical protein
VSEQPADRPTFDPDRNGLVVPHRHDPWKAGQVLVILAVFAAAAVAGHIALGGDITVDITAGVVTLTIMAIALGLGVWWWHRRPPLQPFIVDEAGVRGPGPGRVHSVLWADVKLVVEGYWPLYGENFPPVTIFVRQSKGPTVRFTVPYLRGADDHITFFRILRAAAEAHGARYLPRDTDEGRRWLRRLSARISF